MLKTTLTDRHSLTGVGRRLLFAVALIAWASVAHAQTEELLRQVPPGANAIAVIDAESVLNSEISIRSGWKNKRDLHYGERPLMIPTEAQTVVVAAQLDPAEEMRRVWELALMDLSVEFPIAAVARTEGGYVDPIRDLPAAWTPSNAFIVELQPRRLGMAFPANRQVVSRWIDFAQKNETVQLSEYLQSAAGLLGGETHMVLAVDLTDIPQRHRVVERLSESETVGGDERKVEQIADLITGIRGVTVTINVTSRISAKVRFDFNESVAPLNDIAKPLALEALSRFDAHIPDLDKFGVTVEGTSVTLYGILSVDGLRRVASLLEAPTTKFSDLQDVQPAEPGTPDYAAASQAYYTSVAALINDLRQSISETRDNHALWMERYGRKVDALPILNVDDELLNWGASIGETFRSMAVAERTSGVRQGVRKSQVYGDYNYSSDGYYSYRPESSRKNEIKREEDARATLMRFDSWKGIEDSQAQIRRSMTQKYGVEF
jgi:hypothetical protein